MSGRIPAIDTAKGLGILCVFLGHLCVADSIPFRMIFNFHMPLFFILSGMVFSLDHLNNLAALTRKLNKNILRPFVFFVLLGSLINIIRGSFLPDNGDIFHWVLEIIKGQPSFVPSAWFLTSLFMTQLVFWLIFVGGTRRRKIIICAILAVVTLLFAAIVIPLYFKYLPTHPEIRDYLSILFPIKIPTIPLSLFFFCIGFFCKKHLLKMPMVFLVPFPFSLFLSALFPAPNMAIPSVPALWCFLPSALIGSFSILAIARLVSFPPLAFIGRNSLTFFMLEGHVVPMVLAIIHRFVPSASTSPMSSQLAPALIPIVLLMSVLCITCLIPAINRLRSKTWHPASHSANSTPTC